MGLVELVYRGEVVEGPGITFSRWAGRWQVVNFD